MVINTLLKPFVWIYKGLEAFIILIGLIIKYFFVGIIVLAKNIGIAILFILKKIGKALPIIGKYLFAALKKIGVYFYKFLKKFAISFAIGIKTIAIGIAIIPRTIGWLVIIGILRPIKKLFKMIGIRLKKMAQDSKDVPAKIKKAIVGKFNNLSFVKNYKNQRELKRQVLLIDFDTEEKRSDKKITFRYVAKNPDGKIITGTFITFSKVDVHSFLLSEGYEVYEIKTSPLIEFLYGNRGNKGKYKNKELVFFLTQLSTYIKSGIPLAEAIKILSRQVGKNPTKQRLFQSIVYELTMGENFSSALYKQGNAFPKLLINMIKTSEMTGELTDTLDDMADYYDAIERTRKQMITAMTYPAIIFVLSIVVLTFIMLFVIPQFVEIYSGAGIDVPTITRVTIAISVFLQNYVLFVFGGLVLLLFLFRYAYIKVKMFRTLVQWIVMHLPVFGKIVIYNEVTMFTKTFSSLLKHNVYITDSMEILSQVTNNEIYKMLVFDTITNLARGESISTSFKDNWAFPTVAFEMLVTGERTGQLPQMMEKVAEYYENEHKNLIGRMKAFIEPIVICFLALVVGFILLSVVVPMFTLYQDLDI